VRALALAVLLCADTAAAAPGQAATVRWIEDDWPRAAAEAREREVPLFVEAWAPW